MIGVCWDPWRFNLGFVSFSMSTKMGLLNSFAIFIYIRCSVTVYPRHSSRASSHLLVSQFNLIFRLGNTNVSPSHLSQTWVFPLDGEGEICGSFCFLNGFFEGGGAWWFLEGGALEGGGGYWEGGFWNSLLRIRDAFVAKGITVCSIYPNTLFSACSEKENC